MISPFVQILFLLLVRKGKSCPNDTILPFKSHRDIRHLGFAKAFDPPADSRGHVT